MSNSAGTPGAITRRQMLRRIGLTALIAGPGAGLLSACATSGGEAPAATASAAPSSGGAVSAANPLGVAANAPLEVVIFNGGLGDKYATDVHEPLYKKAFPQGRRSSTRHAGDRARPCSRGSPAATPPDMVNNSGTEADGQRRAGRRTASCRT